MRKLLIVPILCLGLGGCASLPSIHTIETAIQLGTASIANPVTKQRLYQIESAITIVFAGLNTWKDQCRAGTIPASCKDQIAHVQIFTRQLKPYLVQLRAFVKNNDQVNASVVFNQITDLISAIKSQAATNNIKIGS